MILTRAYRRSCIYTQASHKYNLEKAASCHAHGIHVSMRYHVRCICQIMRQGRYSCWQPCRYCTRLQCGSTIIDSMVTLRGVQAEVSTLATSMSGVGSGLCPSAACVNAELFVFLGTLASGCICDPESVASLHADVSEGVSLECWSMMIPLHHVGLINHVHATHIALILYDVMRGRAPINLPMLYACRPAELQSCSHMGSLGVWGHDSFDVICSNEAEVIGEGSTLDAPLQHACRRADGKRNLTAE